MALTLMSSGVRVGVASGGGISSPRFQLGWQGTTGGSPFFHWLRALALVPSEVVMVSVLRRSLMGHIALKARDRAAHFTFYYH